MQIRHGDLLLIKIDKLPKDVKELERGNVTLARGEATGHAHTVTGKVALLTLEQERYLAVQEATAILAHQEHGPIALNEGIYKIMQQREYAPERVRIVRD